MPDFVALGEILIDFMPCRTQDGRIAYSPYVGGAPANVAPPLGTRPPSSARSARIFSEHCAGKLWPETGLIFVTSSSIRSIRRPWLLFISPITENAPSASTAQAPQTSA